MSLSPLSRSIWISLYLPHFGRGQIQCRDKMYSVQISVLQSRYLQYESTWFHEQRDPRIPGLAAKVEEYKTCQESINSCRRADCELKSTVLSKAIFHLTWQRCYLVGGKDSKVNNSFLVSKNLEPKTIV